MVSLGSIARGALVRVGTAGIAAALACASSSAPVWADAPSGRTAASAHAPLARPAAQTILPSTVNGTVNNDTTGNNWPEFRGNDQHTGYNPYQTTITEANVATLKPKWTNFTYPVAGEMLAANGLVYGVDGGGYLRAWNLATGAVVWTWHTVAKGDAMYAPPSLYHGTLYFGTTGQNETAGVYGVNAKTGNLEYHWTAPSTEFSFQASPLIANGLIYIGVSGFNEDTHICDTYDNLIALSPFSPTVISGLNLEPGASQVGADIWSAPVLDLSGNVYVGTGNSCNLTPLVYQDAVMKLHSSFASSQMSVDWMFQSPGATPGNDLDFGATHIFVNGLLIASGKDGTVYAFNANTGKLVWKTAIGEVVGTPATDGVRVYEPVNFVPAYGSNGSCMQGAVCGAFIALNLKDGSVAWGRPVHEDVVSAANYSPPAISQGMVFTAYDKKFWAFDAVTGKVLWSYPAQGEVWAGISIVNGCLLGAEITNYHAYCFSPNGK